MRPAIFTNGYLFIVLQKYAKPILEYVEQTAYVKLQMGRFSVFATWGITWLNIIVKVWILSLSLNCVKII